MSRTKILAIASGLVVGAILSLRFEGGGALGTVTLLNVSYQVTLLLGGICLGGVFPAKRLWGPFAMAIAPTLVLCVQAVLFSPRPQLLLGAIAEGLLTYVLVGVVVTVPAPLVGGAISLLLSRKQIPQFFYFVVLASTLAAGAVVPRIYFAPFRHAAEVRDRLEGEGVPALLKRIYEAEMSYSAGHPDKLFTCDASQLPGTELKALPWHHYDYDCNSCTRTDHLLNVRRENYEIMLYCPNPASPHNFRVTACPSVSRSKPVFSVDESGQLVQIESGDPARKKVVCDDAGDEVRILGASPPPGTVVPGDQPSVFHLDIFYSLAIDDSAILVMSVAQFPGSSMGCSGSGSPYGGDSVQIPMVYGEHTLKVEVPWSGDTGKRTGGRRFGKGFVGFAPSIRGAHPAYLSVDPEYCYAFGR